MTDLYCVFGNPIAHSKSPVIHAAFAGQTGEDLRYEARLAAVDGFLAAISAFVADGGRGYFPLADQQLGNGNGVAGNPAE